MKQLTKKQTKVVAEAINECMERITETTNSNDQYEIYYRIGRCKARIQFLTKLLTEGYDDRFNTFENTLESIMSE